MAADALTGAEGAHDWGSIPFSRTGFHEKEFGSSALILHAPGCRGPVSGPAAPRHRAG